MQSDATEVKEAFDDGIIPNIQSSMDDEFDDLLEEHLHKLGPPPGLTGAAAPAAPSKPVATAPQAPRDTEGSPPPPAAAGDGFVEIAVQDRDVGPADAFGFAEVVVQDWAAQQTAGAAPCHRAALLPPWAVMHWLVVAYHGLVFQLLSPAPHSGSGGAGGWSALVAPPT